MLQSYCGMTTAQMQAVRHAALNFFLDIRFGQFVVEDFFLQGILSPADLLTWRLLLPSGCAFRCSCRRAGSATTDLSGSPPTTGSTKASATGLAMNTYQFEKFREMLQAQMVELQKR